MVKCEVCGKDLILPYKCKYCGGYFCVEHHLPENHNCQGLVRGRWGYELTRYEKERPTIKPSFKPQTIYWRKIYFSRKEILNLLISIFLVGAIYISNYLLIINYNRISLISSILIGSILAFILHELAHKFTAINYGLRAEYVTSKMGLLFTSISIIPFLPIRIIAPGYVKIISYRYDKNRYGRIALAGPLTNIVLAILFLFLSKVCYPSLILASLINIDIALFNIMPFPILDGSHVFKWNINIWIIAIIFTIILWAICHGII